MWETLRRDPLGKILQRKFITLLTAILVVCFLYILFLPSTVNAAGDAYFRDTKTIIYNDKTYALYPNMKSDGDMFTDDIPNGAAVFAHYEDGKMHAIFLEGVTEQNYTAKDTGSYITFDDSDPRSGADKLTNPSAITPITIDPRAPPAAGDPNAEGYSSCVIEGGFGWIICPLTRTLATGMDYIYGVVASYLEVQPLSTSTDNAMYRAWSQMLNIANILFTIAFLVMIFSLITGSIMTNYSLKKLVPRIIIAAVLVNISYWVCAAAVDLSNILGYSVQNFFEILRNSLVGDEGNSWNLVSWDSIAQLILSGGVVVGSIGVIGTVGVATLAASAVGGGVIFLFLPLLISVFFIILVTFLILAARQAIITILIVLAPLAFVAYLLPNTEEWFDKWRKALFVLLLMFPAFSVVFGGAQLAASIIIQNAAGPNALNMIILAMGVQVAPLAITPLLLKLGGGVLNRFANIVNDPAKGVFDKGKNWANERRDQALSRGNARLASQAERGILNPNRRFNPNSLAYRRNRDKLSREGEKSANDALTSGYFTQTAQGRRVMMMNERAKLEQSIGDNENSAHWNNAVRTAPHLNNRAHRAHSAHKRSDLYKQAVEAQGDEHWAHEQQGNPVLRGIRTSSHMASGRAKLTEESLTNADERRLQTQIATTPGLRDMKVQADVDTAHAQIQSASVTAAGKLRFQQDIQTSAALQNLQMATRLTEGRASVIEDSYKARDDRALQEAITRNDHGMRNLKVRTAIDSGLADSAKKVVEAQGAFALKRTIEQNPNLTAQVIETVRFEKQAAEYDTIVQKAAERSWNDQVENNTATQELHLRAVHSEQGAKMAEQRVAQMVENISAKGAAAPGLLSGVSEATAEQIQETVQATSIVEQAVSSAKIVQQRNMANRLKEEENLRIQAAGIDDQGGVNRVLASAKKAVSDELIKATNNFQDTLDYDIASNPDSLAQGFRAATDPTEKIVYARLMARNAPGLKQLKTVLREYTAANAPDDEEVMLLKEVLSGDDTFRNAGRDMEVWANNERNSNGELYTNFEDVQNTISVINNISADRFARMNAYKQHDALYRLQQNDPVALRGLIERINASPIARNALKQHVVNLVDGIDNGQTIQDPDFVANENLDD